MNLQALGNGEMREATWRRGVLLYTSLDWRRRAKPLSSQSQYLDCTFLGLQLFPFVFVGGLDMGLLTKDSLFFCERVGQDIEGLSIKIFCLRSSCRH